jgi:hypothetical protein
MSASILATKYQCRYCFLAYKLKTNYDKHVLVCDILRKTCTKRKADDELPSMENMYALLTTILLKNQVLEEKYNELSQLLVAKKRKIDVKEWLNGHCAPVQTFPMWLLSLEDKVNATHMHRVFQSGYQVGMLSLLREFCRGAELTEQLCIQAFDVRPGLFYIYVDIDAENQWEVATERQLIICINIITRALLRQFQVWSDENKHQLYDDDYAVKRSKNLMKLLTDKPREIWAAFYKELKRNLRGVTEYEFD